MDLKIDFPLVMRILRRKVVWYNAEAAFADDPATAAYYRAKAEAYGDALYFIQKAAAAPAAK